MMIEIRIYVRACTCKNFS